MTKNVAQKLRLAVTFAILAAPFSAAIAQSATTTTPTPTVVTGTNPEPQVVTGTNPEPQVVSTILLSMILSS
jgi:hypothetical protein